MDQPKISFHVGNKRKASNIFSQSPRQGIETPGTEGAALSEQAAASEESPLQLGVKRIKAGRDSQIKTTTEEPSRVTGAIIKPKSAPMSGDHTQTSARRRQRSLSNAMTEPPSKRAKRTDSSAMWDRNSKKNTDLEHRRSTTEDVGNGRDRREDRERRREDRRHRSRSKERVEKRRERSRSRERDGEKHRNGDRGGERERRDRERSTSRDRHRSRRNDPSPRRGRHRSRSRSPARDSKMPPNRARSPLRTQPPKPTSSKAPPSNTTKPPPPLAASPPETQNAKAYPAKSKSSNSKPSAAAANTNGTTNATHPPAESTLTAMDVDSDPEVALMRKMMGFSGFKSTKNTKVPGNDVYAVRKEKKTEYRQYMNRVGGFNRPLSPSR